MVSYELYRIFYTVAFYQNITKASEVLNISQPAVTKHIKNLEGALGVILFTRTRKGVVLTPIGQEIFLKIKNAITILENVEEEVKNYNKQYCGTIRIGISTSLVKTFLIEKLKSFHKKYPEIVIEINTDTTKENICLLENGLLDILICKRPEELDKDLKFELLGETSYEFVANKEWYEKIKTPISLKKLKEYPILLQKAPSNAYKSAKNLFKTNHIEIDSKLNIGSSSLVVDFAKIGYGIGYVTKLYIQKELKNKELFIIETIPKTPKIAYGIISLQNNVLAKSTQLLIEDLLK